jgi:short-subunit dehydrogenase
MAARKNGQLAVMASLSSLFPLMAAPDYAAAKANVLSLGRALRGYLAPHKVGVTVLCPGFVRTALLNRSAAAPARRPRAR